MLSGSCHCGATHFTVNAAPGDVTECNCSYCSKVGGLWAYYPPEAVIVTEQSERVYSQTGFNKHHFCAMCGCSTYGTSPDWSLDGNHDMSKIKVGINARLLDNFDLSAVPVKKIDGRNLW